MYIISPTGTVHCFSHTTHAQELPGGAHALYDDPECTVWRADVPLGWVVASGTPYVPETPAERQQRARMWLPPKKLQKPPHVPQPHPWPIDPPKPNRFFNWLFRK